VARACDVAFLATALGLAWASPGGAAETKAWGGADVAAGGFLWRHPGDRSPDWHQGLELAWGPSLAETEGAWRFTGLVQMDLRAFAATSWALALSSHTFEVTGRLGPLEPYARVGGALLTVDDFDGACSAELLSPRVGAGVAVRVARKVDVGVGLYAEYFWRWFGPSAFVRGVVLDLRFERPSRARQK
jgi:hypothetical protein